MSDEREVTFVKVEIGEDERTYRIMETNAPSSYDSAGVLYIEDGYDATTGKPMRILLVPDDALSWCKGRYESGLYTLRNADDWLREVIEEKLWEKLYAKN